jgi:hypothetical protein
MSIEAMKQALEALDSDDPSIQLRAAVVLRQAIEQAEKQEPVIGTKTWFEDGKVVTQHLHPSDIYANDISQERVDETVKDRHEPVFTKNELIRMAKKAGLAWVEGLNGAGYGINKVEDLQNFAAIVAASREWVGLTDEEILAELPVTTSRPATSFARAIEAKLKEKNT